MEVPFLLGELGENMIVNKNYINVQTNVPKGVTPLVMQQIEEHLQQLTPFALYTNDYKSHVVFVPSMLTALFSTGEKIKYNTGEDFGYALWLTLFLHQRFYKFPKRKLTKDRKSLVC
jgi:hypothetical protein